MRLADARRDHYRRLAKDQGYRSRAAYKLKQINDSYRILRRGNRIVDIGCAPGGWVQVATEEVGPGNNKVVGIDLKEVEPVAGATILQGSIDDPVAVRKIIEALGEEKADVVLSDLAPNVSGMWEVDHARQIDLTRSALALAKQVLKGGGSAVFKVFEGEFLNELKNEMKASFAKVLISKPTASRQESSELYLVCIGFRHQ
ncbi:23S rRNA Um-2552 2'-O-methyltransferase [Candidatus Nitrososphaera evergladensis SR1]|jgi:23S rRNA (uridine2552-2'-O)-methyltransferase|uniref:Ribosomal RNA large subunit methyltransferase E n=1 Tax=Candidatus Nitrososphaera evergladensis SR1 TaxID=1459636 RepID=A0A075MNE0_9ARCH|nr:RlmE family RNA methyltransferase [Candidatus Nitrososphaera evergladensis]AIF82728.1 23S rRNA Um-2552 2'-O-methyltransferase [Candidatus Nitrososphaera evergladensis SR1]